MRRGGRKGMTIPKMKGHSVNMLKEMAGVEKIPTALPHPHRNLGTYLHPKKSSKKR